jgi:hypothetical protein
MAEISHVRQQVALARKYISEGQLAKAKNCLKGLEHPKAQALLVQIENHAKHSPQTKVSLPMLLGIGLIGLVLLLFVLGFALFNHYQDLNLTLPTLIPTPDCSIEIIKLWWDEQNLNLDTFLVNASAASRTMPGERLFETLSAIAFIRLEFDSIPGCANLELQQRFNELLLTMDELLAVLESWSNGELDGTSLSSEFYSAETAFRDARQSFALSINH